MNNKHIIPNNLAKKENIGAAKDLILASPGNFLPQSKLALPVRPDEPKSNPVSDITDPVEFARKRLNFHPDPIQAKILRSTAPRGILNCTRQWGKSTVCAAKAVHRAYTQPGSLIVVAAPCGRQSGEFLRKTAELLTELDITARGDGTNRTSLLFPNKSRIVGLPGSENKVRGFSGVSLLIIDEAAQVSDSLYKALRPMLIVSGGDLWLMSTPYGKRGFFYSIWTHESAAWDRVTVPATECPRIDPARLEAERASIGASWFQQEYMCSFIDNSGSVFGREIVDRALDASIQPITFRPTQIWKRN